MIPEYFLALKEMWKVNNLGPNLRITLRALFCSLFIRESNAKHKKTHDTEHPLQGKITTTRFHFTNKF